MKNWKLYKQGFANGVAPEGFPLDQLQIRITYD